MKKVLICASMLVILAALALKIPIKDLILREKMILLQKKDISIHGVLLHGQILMEKMTITTGQ